MIPENVPKTADSLILQLLNVFDAMEAAQLALEPFARLDDFPNMPVPNEERSVTIPAPAIRAANAAYHKLCELIEMDPETEPPDV